MAPHHTRDRHLYAVLGFLLGLGAPLGWLIWRSLFAQSEWLRSELSQFGLLYAYMTVGTVLGFTLFGYFLGRRSDIVEDQSETVSERLVEANQLAMTDALTNIYNARYLHNQLSIETEATKRYKSQLTCIMLDIDDFKTINDRYGHPCGDIILSTLAKILQQNTRRVDIVGRLGGEEFLAIMPHTPPDLAVAIAERIRQAIKSWSFKIDGMEVSVTVSIGVASFPLPGIKDKASLLKATDDALYEAKRSGKNRTVLWRKSE